MNIDFVCEHCGKTLSLEDYLGGQSVECYYCHGPVVVPQEGEVGVIEFQCLGCGTSFRVPGRRAGSRAKCPKCQAVLVVPQASAGPGSPPRPTISSRRGETSQLIFEESLPPLARARPVLQTHRGVGPPGPGVAGPPPRAAASGEEFVKPSQPRVKPGWIIFWVALGLLGVASLVLLIAKRSREDQAAATRYVQILAKVNYKQGLDVFQIVNITADVWHEVTFTIETTSGDYFYRTDTLRPNEPLEVEGKRFTSKGGVAFDNSTTTCRRFITTARLASGRLGQSVLKWAGSSPQ